MNYLTDNALGLPKRAGFTTFNHNALVISLTTLRLLPQRCFPYLVKWYELTPRQRLDMLHAQIEFLVESPYLSELVEDWRTSPIGMDRQGRMYWMFYFSSFIWVESKSGEWTYINDMSHVKGLITCLDERHADEYRLKTDLIDEKDEISQMLSEWSEAMARQHEPEVEVRRSTRRVLKEAEDSADAAAKTMDDILVDEVNQVAKRLYEGQLGLEDDRETIECLVDSAIGELQVMKETMVRFISAIPHTNLNDHLWNGKEFPKFIEVRVSSRTTIRTHFHN